MLYVKLILWNSTTIIKWKVIQIRKDWSRLTFHINSISYSNLLMFYIYILTTAIFIESSVGTCQPSVCVCVSIYINYRNIYNVISRLPATQVSVCVCVCVCVYIYIYILTTAIFIEWWSVGCRQPKSEHHNGKKPFVWSVHPSYRGAS